MFFDGGMKSVSELCNFLDFLGAYRREFEKRFLSPETRLVGLTSQLRLLFYLPFPCFFFYCYHKEKLSRLFFFCPRRSSLAALKSPETPYEGSLCGVIVSPKANGSKLAARRLEFHHPRIGSTQVSLPQRPGVGSSFVSGSGRQHQKIMTSSGLEERCASRPEAAARNQRYQRPPRPVPKEERRARGASVSEGSTAGQG